MKIGVFGPFGDSPFLYKHWRVISLTVDAVVGYPSAGLFSSFCQRGLGHSIRHDLYVDVYNKSKRGPLIAFKGVGEGGRHSVVQHLSAISLSGCMTTIVHNVLD